MFNEFRESVKAFMEHDPAAKSPFEIIFLYPGFKALRSHKTANWFFGIICRLLHAISAREAHIKQGLRYIPVLRSEGVFALTTGMALLLAKLQKLGMMS